jgi:hypothetical protein
MTLVLVTVMFFCGSSVFGATLSLKATWTANTESDMKEYRLYRTDGTRTLVGATPHPNTSYPFAVTVPDGSSGTLKFVLTAVDTNNNESTDSNLATYNYDLRPTVYTISGYVRTGGTGISGVVMNGLPGNPTTDSNGYYSVTVSSGWSGTVTPSKSGYTFTPSSRSYSNVTSNQTNQNYTGTAITFTISGNAGVAGATLSYTDGTSKTATADSSGNYSFTVSYNWSGTVTPSKSGYTFTPPSRSYGNVTSNQTNQNYTATTTEVISTPKIPSGPSSGYTGTSCKFSTGGSTSSLGSSHPVEYQFSWGDGTVSSWGSNSQSRVWTVPGTYSVQAKARCKKDPNSVSAWSNSSSISVQGKPFIQVTSPNGGEDLVVGNSCTITWNSAYLNPGGTLYLFYSFDGVWHPIATLAAGTSSVNWTIPRISGKATSPKPSGSAVPGTLWIGNWVNEKWECYDKNDYKFWVLYDGWVCTISGEDHGGATLLFDQGVFDGYGISLELGMFGIQGNYSLDAKGLMSGAYTVYDFANPAIVFYSGNFKGSVNSSVNTLRLALSDGNGKPVFNISGQRLLNDPVIPRTWTGAISGSAGTLDPLTIIPYQLGPNLYSHVFEFSGSGSITGSGSINILAHFYFTSAKTSYSGTNVYGIYQMTGAVIEDGTFTGNLNPSSGKMSLTMTNSSGNKWTLVGKKTTP